MHNLQVQPFYCNVLIDMLHQTGVAPLDTLLIYIREAVVVYGQVRVLSVFRCISAGPFFCVVIVLPSSSVVMTQVLCVRSIYYSLCISI